MLSCEGDSEYIFVFSPTFLWSLLEAQVTAPVAHLSFLYPKGDSLFLGFFPHLNLFSLFKWELLSSNTLTLKPPGHTCEREREHNEARRAAKQQIAQHPVSTLAPQVYTRR